ncbi:putative outer membrane protein [Escherichia coli DEC4F]|nr:putative outer membrane protein [Escherichia coli DEC4F]
MRKLYAAILSAAICLAVSGAPAWASEHQSTLSAGVSSCPDQRSRQ